jgi:hypothetical protein
MPSLLGVIMILDCSVNCVLNLYSLEMVRTSGSSEVV